MITKFDGTCRYCNLPTRAGIDFYDVFSASSFHAVCPGNEIEGEFIDCPPITDVDTWCYEHGYVHHAIKLEGILPLKFKGKTE